MHRSRCPKTTLSSIVLAVLLAISADSAEAQKLVPTFFPTQRSISVRDPSELQPSYIPNSLTPSSVSNPQPDLQKVRLSLDEAIRLSIGNTDVVRVLAGTTATNSGRTIFDPAIANTAIDQENARFDPTLSVSNSWNRLENPQAIFDPVDPTRSLITGVGNDQFLTGINLTKQNAFGGTFGVGYDSSFSELSPGTFPLNPETRSSTNLNYTQPLLQGGGLGPNLAPIVLARIDTERSYFQLKDAMQENVRGVIEAYWSLVSARTDLWARRTQVEQLTEILRRVEATVRQGTGSAADEAQAKLALANFRANLIAAEANVIQTEAAMRNLLGLPPSDGLRLIPNTPPQTDRFQPDWYSIVNVAGERRPDVIELKLIIEADQQLLQIAKNNALPRLDAVSQYRWNGLHGTMPVGSPLSSNRGAFTDWTLGVNFSVPLGLRQSRAALRAQEMVIARDRINLQQGLHSAVHQLATSIRALDQTYEQYLAFREAREAAHRNLQVQVAKLATGTVLFINVQQAVTDWGNLISSEASALTQYNTQLATLERQTGTILESHSIVFYEERFGPIRPLGEICENDTHPWDMRPSLNADRYTVSDEPSEDFFDLQQPGDLREKMRDLNYDDIKLPTLEELMRDQGDVPPPPPIPEPPIPDPPIPPDRERKTPPNPENSQSNALPPETETARLTAPRATMLSRSWFGRFGRRRATNSE